ncbi:MAG: Regulator of ribonuclease [Actinomycetota bacterium]
MDSYLSEQLDKNKQIVELRESMGDDSSAIHEVDHSIFFMRRSYAKLAASQLELLGHKVSFIKRRWLEIHLKFVTSEPTTLAHQNETTKKLVKFARSYRGVYNGWGSYVIEKAVEE